MDKEIAFLEKLAKAYQTYDVSPIADDLSDDMHYASMWVFQELQSKAEYLDYLEGKLQTMKNSNKTFEFKIVNGGMHSKALLIDKVNGVVDRGAGFVVDFNEDGKVSMLNITAPEFF